MITFENTVCGRQDLIWGSQYMKLAPLPSPQAWRQVAEQGGAFIRAEGGAESRFKAKRMEKGSPYLLYRLIRLATEIKAEGKALLCTRTYRPEITF